MVRKKRSAPRPGTLMLIGGAEDKFEQKFLLKNFFESSGGRKARIAILPSASESEESGAVYHQIFTDFGAQSVQLLPLFKREEAELPDVAKDIMKATGIFMTGGDQSKIVGILHATAALGAIKSAYDNGATVGGTSAGAAAMSNPMIASGLVGSLARSGMVKLQEGLGLTESLLIDQHFHQRNRLGRLLTAVMSYPKMLGLGVDEDTAALVTHDGFLSVIGRGTVTIADASEAHSVNLAITPDKSPLAFCRMVLHTLVHGGKFDLNKRTVIS
ncbi:MAG TPA: cyanophycinase [Blastocatellia bacterium]|jgi:cyanophycinase|nr:cyanophycinase [Blastocatellia bacterium]